MGSQHQPFPQQCSGDQGRQPLGGKRLQLAQPCTKSSPGPVTPRPASTGTKNGCMLHEGLWNGPGRGWPYQGLFPAIRGASTVAHLNLNPSSPVLTALPPTHPLKLSQARQHPMSPVSREEGEGGLVCIPGGAGTMRFRFQLFFFDGVHTDDGWFKQPNVTESDWTMGLGEAAHLLHNEESVCTC
ncbi:unnamed protein product [Arctogadus glacialis]